MIGKRIVVLFAALFASLGARAGDAPAGHLEELTRLSVGSFSTTAQSARDARYGVAEAEIVRIWPDRDDGVWLYQEQAFLGDRPETADPAVKGRPYFARVIHSIEAEPGVVVRSVHKLKDPAPVVGAWREAAPLAALTPDDLEPSECMVIARRIAEGMWQAQSEKCPNAYKGAAYAVSLGIVTDGAYANWDRGFSADGELVWGPEGGGYVFVRKDARTMEGDAE